jgi:hypothetical protein
MISAVSQTITQLIVSATIRTSQWIAEGSNFFSSVALKTSYGFLPGLLAMLRHPGNSK